jgi:hypothetical protein
LYISQYKKISKPFSKKNIKKLSSRFLNRPSGIKTIIPSKHFFKKNDVYIKRHFSNLDILKMSKMEKGFSNPEKMKKDNFLGVLRFF